MAQVPSRPAVRGTHYMVSSGHYLASAAGVRIFEQGGNAIDAGVAAGLVLNVVLPEWTGIGGVAPILIYDGQRGAVWSVRGLGRWPRATDVHALRRRWSGCIPVGVWRCVTPAALGAWLTALQRFGRLRLEEVIAPALELAERGFPVHPALHHCLAELRSQVMDWPGTHATFYPDGEVPATGTRLVQAALAGTLRWLIEVAQRHEQRERSIAAAYDLFYRGEIAHTIADFFDREGGWLRYDDLAEYEVIVEEPVRTEYRNLEVYACGPWCQGPIVLQTLNVLELESVGQLGHNTPAYIHQVVEAMKLAFADREAYYGDPGAITIPLHGLLSKAYARAQHSRIDTDRSVDGRPPPGNPWQYQNTRPSEPASWYAASPIEEGTSYVCAVDAEGRAFSATPSDGIRSAPVVPGLGFAISSRGAQSWLDPQHPWTVQPGKHPFLTPNPGLALKDGRFFLAFGTPGTDTQPQAMVQLLMNVIEFGMDLQQAVEAPRFATYSFPRANDPHPYEPASLSLEARISAAAAARLSQLGHRIRWWPEYAPEAGALCAIMQPQDNGFLIGAADPRRLCYAIGW